MEYTPKKSDIMYAKKVYDNIIFTQTLNPNEVKLAFKKLFGYDAVNPNQAKQKVAAYFLYTYKEEIVLDVTTTKPEYVSTTTTDIVPLSGFISGSTSMSVSNTNQTHQEDFTPVSKPKRKRSPNKKR